MMQQRGFTLIEVLVASAIFVGVMVIGVSSFSNVNHINDQIQVTRNLSQTGNFVMETLARDIRSAMGEKNLETGKFDNLNFPFDFRDENAVIQNLSYSDGLIHSLIIMTRKQGGDHCYMFNPTNVVDHYDLVMNNGNCSTLSAQSLLPAGIQILNPSFVGISHQASSKVQPFVTIKFTLVDTLAAPPSAQQTFQTTVTSLVYAGQ